MPNISQRRLLFLILFWGLIFTPTFSQPLRPAQAHVQPSLPRESILVRWKDQTFERNTLLSGERQRLLTLLNAQPVGKVPQLRIERWDIPGNTLSHALAVINRSPAVDWAEPNYTFHLDPFETESTTIVSPPTVEDMTAPSQFPNDPQYNSYAFRYLDRLGVVDAWHITLGDPRITVAVIDTGVDCTHPDLAGHCWVNEDEIPNNGKDDDHNGYVDDRFGWNFVEDRGDPRDVHRHGTHVAGILAATTNNGIGIAGIAGRTTIMPLVVFTPMGVGTYYDLIRAILYAADNGAKVINMSLGATTYSKGEALAVAYAHQKGVVIVAAAGNNNFDRVFYPAAHAQVIGVAATDSEDQIAWFSNYGSYISVAAPGVSIISTIPGGSYGIMCGTSMATPHVSGLAALILARNPTLSPTEVRTLIETRADDQVGPPDKDVPGWDPFYGFGRIHVGRTVSETHPAAFPPEVPQGDAPLLPWPATCRDLLHNGDFEEGLTSWEGEGMLLVDAPVYQGNHAVRLPAHNGTWMSQTFTLPPRALQMTVFMAIRIETQDAGVGSTPTFPFDDWLTLSLKGKNGQPVVSLLRAGNTSDGVHNGLAWDEFLAVLPASEWGHLRGQEVQLSLETGEDGDTQTTTFTVDAIRLCVVEAQWQRIFSYFPMEGKRP